MLCDGGGCCWKRWWVNCRKRSYNFVGVWIRWVDIYHNGRYVWIDYHWSALYWSEIYMIVGEILS